MLDNKAEIDGIYKKLSVRADALYRFVIKYYEYMNEARDYGTGEKIGMVEVHTLSMIEDNPGIIVSGIAKMWGRTLGAASQNVKKLEQKGLIRKEKGEGNDKNVHLYVTEKGRELSTAHKMYDNMDIMETMNALMQNCSLEEINAFYKVIDVYTGLFEE